MPEEMELEGTLGEAKVPDWLEGLLQAVQSGDVPPRDGRVRSLWDLLKQRQLLTRSVWLQTLLRRIWDRGLPTRPRPRTARVLERRLRLWGILPSEVRRPAAQGLRPIPSGKLVTVRPLRPVTVRPLKPMRVRPVGPVKARR
jgi:hypothetical protein